MVWGDDWTDDASPMYVLLSNIFGDQAVPGEYGNNDRVWLDAVTWRERVLNI